MNEPSTTGLEIVEVSPRDGLQNEKTLLSTQDKLELISASVAAGARRIEATSFVHPRAVPQMADAEAVMAGLPRQNGVRYSGLVLNLRGLERAVAAGIDEINCVVVSTETFSQRNQHMSVDDAVEVVRAVMREVEGTPIAVAVTLAVAFGCPFEGWVAPEDVARLARRVADLGVREISLADTIGVGVPSQVRTLAAMVGAAAPEATLRCHFHNTRNTGYANAAAAFDAGIRIFDSSSGGIGGCPFAPAATGNIATEDLVYLFERMGLDTGMDINRLIETSGWLGERLGAPTPALLPRAGDFPPVAPDGRAL